MNASAKVRVIKRGGVVPGTVKPGAAPPARPARGAKETVGSWVEEFERRRRSDGIRSFESLFEKERAGGEVVKGCEDCGRRHREQTRR